MNIVYATSDLYSRPAVVSIKSLLMNQKNTEIIHIYYIENGIADENKKLIRQLVEEYGGKIDFIAMPNLCSRVGGLLRTNAVTYSYCFFQDILPKTVDRVLLLEADTLVAGDLTKMYETDLEGYYIAASDDFQSRWYKRKLGMNEKSPYFNSGVMLLNLKKCREDDVTGKMNELLTKGKSKFFYEVQDEMNVLFEGHVKTFPPKCNCTTSVFLFDYKNMRRYRRPSTCCSREKFEQAKKNPLIIHFTSNQIIQSRPWVEGCTHPYCDYYMKVKRQTAVRSEALWKSGRKWTSKAVYFVYSKISKTLVAVCVGFIHSFLYPVFLYKLMLKK